MSETTREEIQAIQRRLKRAFLRLAASEALAGLLLVLTALITGWLVLVGLESAFWMSLGVRRWLIGIWLVLILGMFGVLVARPLLRLARSDDRLQQEHIARLVGSHYPEVSDRLVNLLQLARSAESGASPMVEGAVRMLADQVSPYRFNSIESFERPRQSAYLAAGPIAILLLLAVSIPDPFGAASGRLVALGTEFERPAPFAWHVSPGDAELTVGEPLSIRVEASGRALPPAAAIDILRHDVERPESVPMDVDEAGGFIHNISSARASFRYRIENQGVASPWFSVDVRERPVLQGIAIHLTPPAYTGLPVRRLANAGDVNAPRGTTAEITTTLGGAPVADAHIEFDDGTQVPLEIADGAASGTFTVREEATYRIIALGRDGARNADPIRYRILPLDDQPPFIELLAPGTDVTLDEQLRQPVGARISDDFGFSRLLLHYRLADSRYRTPQTSFTSAPLQIQTPRPVEQIITYDWLLRETNLDLVPGDVVEFYLEVWDNDGYIGAKPARSTTRRLRVPSLVERYEDVNLGQDDLEDAMSRLREEAEGVRRDFEELREDLRGKQEADWQDRRRLESLQERQESMASQVEEISRQMSDLADELGRNDLLSPETIQTYQELQRVIDEINSPELMDALRQLQEAMENLDLQQMQESMGDFEFNEEQYQQRLERTLRLFQRARVMQSIEQAERLASDLAERQEMLREQTSGLEENPADSEQDAESDGEGSDRDGSNADGDEQGAAPSQQNSDMDDESASAPTAEQVADEQERTAEDAERLEEMLEEIQRQIDELGSGQRPDLDQLREETRREQIPERMREAGSQIRQQQNRDAQTTQQQLQQQLQMLQQELGGMRQGMQSTQMRVNLDNLRRTLRQIITLSHDQEDIQAETTSMGRGSAGLPPLARTQIRIAEGTGVVADSIRSLATDIPEMTREVQRHTGEALREMGRATEAMAERASREAGLHQRTSMMHLNELGLILSDLLDQLMNQQGGGEGGMSAEEMANQLQQMAGQQQQLNQQIQEMLNEMGGERMSIDMQERLQQMAGEQDEIRRRLRSLSRDPLARQGMARELNRVAQQMSETIEELQRSGASRQMIERQQQILTRLLEAEESLQEREMSDERRGTTGRDIPGESPEELERSRELEKLRQDLIRALESDYAHDYQELIRRYFELLRRTWD